jgi:ribonuclease HI
LGFFRWGFPTKQPIVWGGPLLYLKENHFFKMKMGMGSGTNNYVELMSLKLLLLFVGEKGVKSIQIFGDSLNVINWVRKSQKCHNIQLLPLLEEIFRFMDTFDSLCVWHVYREHNMDADMLSKAGLQMGMGQWMISEVNNGEQFEYYHRPFIDRKIINAISFITTYLDFEDQYITHICSLVYFSLFWNPQCSYVKFL